MNKENLTLKIKKLDNFVSMPEYKTSGASAMDLVAAIEEDIEANYAKKSELTHFSYSDGRLVITRGAK